MDANPILVIDQVVAGSTAARVGLRPGMRVVAVGVTPVHTKAEFEVAIASYDRTQGLPLKVETPDGQIASVRVGGPTTGRR